MWERPTLCAPTPPRVLGRVHTLRAHITPRIGVCSHHSRPRHPAHWGVPYAHPHHPAHWGRVHTLPAHTTPCIGAFTLCAPTLPRALGHTLCAHTTPHIGACSHPSRPHHPAHWGVFTPFAPTPPRALGVSTPFAPTPPRALGRVHSLCAHTAPRIRACPHPARPAIPCIGVCPHPARPRHPVYWGVFTPFAPTPPRALWRVHILSTHAAPRMWERALRAPNRPVHWSIHTLRAHIIPCIGAYFLARPLCLSPLSRRSPPTRYEKKTHAAVRFVGRVRSI